MSTKGQALIEYILVFPLILGFWVALAWFAKVYTIEIELLHAARYGVFWLAYNHDLGMSKDAEKARVGEECRSFLQRAEPSIDLSQVHFNIQTGNRWKAANSWRQLLSSPFGIFRLVDKLTDERNLKRLAGIAEPLPAKIAVIYSLPAPRLFQMIPGFPASIPLRAFCECYR